jgi:transposase
MHMSSSLNSSVNGSGGPSSEAVSEGARRASGETASGAPRRDPEVFAVGRRRQFSGSEKRALLAEAERRKAAGTLGAFMREKHVYSSMLSSWRKQLGASDRVALAPKRRGPKPDPSARQVMALTRDNARLRRQLERAELIIDAQKKLCVALGLPTSDDRSEQE